MGQKVVFDGRIFIEPVSRGRIISGVQNIGAPQSFGNIAIIDTGLGAGFGGGVGSVDSGANVRQLQEFGVSFANAAEMKNFVKGGVFFDLADYLYAPSNSAQGASRVDFLQARQTTAGQDTATFTNTFDMVLNTLEEGLFVNGVLNGSDLQNGYAWTITAGLIDPAKFIFKFFLGTFRGADANSFLFDGITAADAAKNPQLITQSVEVADLSELITWAATDVAFTELFEFDATSATSGVIVAADLTLLAGFQLFAGGAETYNSTAMDNVLDEIKALDNSFFLATEVGANAAGVNNLKILAHINNEAEFKKFIIIGGGDVKSEFVTESLAAAATINSRFATVIHGGIEEPYVLNPELQVPKSSVYKAALYTGRAAGVEPQVPLTYKDLRIRKEQHVLTETERVQGIDGGVAHTRFVPTLGIVVNQSINTLQLNDFLFNPDGSSPEFSVERIEAQLNREIAEGAKVLFIGGNLSTVSEAVVVSYAIGYLQSQVAEPGISDGLIVLFLNVKAKRTGTTWFVTYDFQANTPINKIFSTGTVIDPTL